MIKQLQRPRNVILLVLLAVFVVVLVWGLSLLYWAITVKAKVNVDYGKKLNELAENFQPAGALGDGSSNAMQMLMAASSSLKDKEATRIAAAGGSQAQPVDWPKYTWPFDHSAVFNPVAPPLVRDPSVEFVRSLKQSGLLELQDRFAGQPGGLRVLPENQWLLTVLLPDLGASRNMARMNRARMYLAHEEGDNAEFVRAFEHLLAAGRIHMHQPVLIERLVGIACIASATLQERECILEKPVDAATLRAMLGAMDRQLSSLPTMELSFEGERMFLLDSVQRMFSDDGNGDGYLISNVDALATGTTQLQSSGTFGRLASRFMLASRKETLKEANAMYDELIASSKVPFVRERKQLQPLEQRIEGLSRRYLFLRTLMPAFSRALSSDDQFRCDVAGTRLMLTIELFKVEKGHYPKAIEDLVPEYIADVPAEPFRKSGFVYKQMAPGEDSRGRLYLLYSVGRDGVDNGGRRAKLNISAATGSSDGAGMDYIINEPREEAEQP